jgi:hypothetical protein
MAQDMRGMGKEFVLYSGQKPLHGLSLCSTMEESDL